MSEKPVQPRRATRFGLGGAMLLIAGMALGLSLIVDESRSPTLPVDAEPHFGALGLHRGASPYSSSGECRSWRRHFCCSVARDVLGDRDEFYGSAQGTASWLLWPPVLYHRIAHGGRLGETTSGVCYFYGTPLMAIYMTSALLAGGHLRRGKRRLRDRSWEEKFGLFLGTAWACTGLYFLVIFYRQDFFKR